ncbi:MAG: GNAT family N-acetyltransferase [Acidimicrobiaceae bacterium]|nr:GNAT family N-acetyltransferase [Acidimicrobiaceae bacterium]
MRYRLEGRRIYLRPLVIDDFEAWREVRVRCNDWLRKWEPRTSIGSYQLYDKRIFGARCATAERERISDSAYAFGLFLGDRFIGEANISSIQRGPCQTGNVGYWIDENLAGNGYMPEAVALVMRFAFETVSLHRIQISIIPRNFASRRVPEKLKLRLEGISLKYLEINGSWEDHVHYAITQEEWILRKAEFANLYFQ